MYRRSRTRWCFFFQAEDGIRDLVRSRGLGDVYKRQVHAARARVWLMTHGADWLCVILDSAADPHDVLARSLADEAWYARARRAAQDAPR